MFDVMAEDLAGRDIPQDRRAQVSAAIKFWRKEVERQLCFIAVGRAAHLSEQAGDASHCRSFLGSSCCDERFKVACRHHKEDGSVGSLERPTRTRATVPGERVTPAQRQADAAAAAAAAVADRSEVLKARALLSKADKHKAERQEAKEKKEEEKKRAQQAKAAAAAATGCRECKSTQKQAYNVCEFCPASQQRMCWTCYESHLKANGGYVGERVEWRRKGEKGVVTRELPCAVCQRRVDAQRHQNLCVPCNALAFAGVDVEDFVDGYINTIMTEPFKHTPLALEAGKERLREFHDRLSSGETADLAECTQVDIDGYSGAVERVKECGGGETDVAVHSALLARVIAATKLSVRAATFKVDKKTDLRARAAAYRKKLGMADSHVIRVEQQKVAKYDAVKKVETDANCAVASVIRDYWQKFKAPNGIAEQGKEPPAISCESFAVTLKLPGDHDFSGIAPEGAKAGDVVTIVVTCASDNDDQVCQHSDRNLETVRKILREKVPWVKEIMLHGDGAQNYKKMYASIRVAGQKAAEGPRVISWDYNEPG